MEDHSNTKNITIKEQLSQRIDSFLAQKFPQFPRNFWQKQIKNGIILVNRKKVKPHHKINLNDKVSFPKKILTEPRKKKLIANPNINYQTIHQSEDFLVIEKPTGLTVHPAELIKNGKYLSKNTLVSGLLADFPQIKNVGENNLRPGIVHRLDKETSGLMIIALNQKNFHFFKQQFQQRKVKKKYLAQVWGKMKKKTGTVETLIGKSKANPAKQSTSKKESKLINPKTAITHWQVLKTEQTKSLLLVEIETGRKHQIRVHLHSIGHPIVGDKKYQTKLVKEKNKSFSRQHLHAHELEFQAPDGKIYHFKSKSKLSW